ncbi:actin or actin-binding cytoskeletal protein [Lithospermum erythrorhizon]|uniref:Actin or actin-binding cytoskeletal protein n=1 Tax=Lithospermum erythrorhizon TaxID=34254 RepID=A0AAV3RWS7_LITER
MSTASTARRPKWHPTPPPPSPKILHFPRRIRRKQPKKASPTTTKIPSRHHSHDPTNFHKNYYHFSDNKKTRLESLLGQEQDFSDNKQGRLETLFGQEKEFTRTDNDVPVVLLNSSYSFSCSDEQRRERVEDMDNDESLMETGFGEDKWRFQAEILRAECSFLRMEREFALKKLERNRKQLERALTSAVQALISGQNKMCERKNGNVEFEKELKELAEKLIELQKSSRAKDVELRNCHNFDKQACRLQHHLEKLGGRVAFEKSLQEKEESSLPTNASDDIDKESDVSELKNRSMSSDNVKVEVLRRKMEGFSMGMLDRMAEEYGSILTATTNTSVASSASTSKRIDYPQPSGSLTRQMCQGMLIRVSVWLAEAVGLPVSRVDDVQTKCHKC